MKKLFFAALLCASSFNANAGMIATIVSCKMETSFTGKLIYVGTYNAGGHYVQFVFGSYCPASVQVE